MHSKGKVRAQTVINFQRFSKKVGLFKKEHALAAIVTINDQQTPELDFSAFREGLLAWSGEFGGSCKELIFTFMAPDSKQQHVLGFFRCLLNDSEVCSLLGTVQMKLQFPSMSKAVADETHARIYAKEL